MRLTRLQVDGVRNLSKVSLSKLGRVNIIFGENGSGKTSLLESIHLLGLARSFRGNQILPVINYQLEECTVFGQVSDFEAQCTHDIGISRTKKGKLRVRIDADEQRNSVLLAETLPLQLINAQAFQLLEGGPKQRRQLMDWGVFHVEHEFLRDWRAMQRCVKQRNSVLRQLKTNRTSQKGIDATLAPWNRELLALSEKVDRLRSGYLAGFMPVFTQALQELIDIQSVKLGYQRGWPDNASLKDCLAADLSRDLKRGVTHSGPHRADISVTVKGLPAVQVLSRGQQKMLVCAMRIAQTELLYRQTGKHSVMLVDDLPAEMDTVHLSRLCALLDRMSAQPQLFMTAVDPDSLSAFCWSDTVLKVQAVSEAQKGIADTSTDNRFVTKPGLFHVEQGQISVVASEKAALSE